MISAPTISIQRRIAPVGTTIGRPRTGNARPYKTEPTTNRIRRDVDIRLRRSPSSVGARRASKPSARWRPPEIRLSPYFPIFYRYIRLCRKTRGNSTSAREEENQTGGDGTPPLHHYPTSYRIRRDDHRSSADGQCPSLHSSSNPDNIPHPTPITFLIQPRFSSNLDNPPPSARDDGNLFQTVPNRTKRRHATRNTSKNPRNCEKNIKFFAKNTSISFIYMV